MVSLAACRAADVWEDKGWVHVDWLPRTENTPIPGMLLLTNDRQDLLMILPDGRAIDLLKIYHAAEDAVRNGFNGTKDKPAFIADWPKMTALATALNGETP